ncbi:MAG: RNA-binding protein [Thioalkalivibrio sp.]|nr:RNA-binding protein [Thioalkalivibrio sp.]
MGKASRQDEPISAGLRIDKWLWAARFYKTRALASEAVAGGKVHVNGDRCKPARRVYVGDRLTVHRGPQIWELEIVALNDQRRPAREAQALYLETPESQDRRQAENERRRAERAAADPSPGRRPDKRERRKIRRFIRQEDND